MCLLVSRCFINIMHKLKSYCKLICQLNNYCNHNHFWFQSMSLRLPRLPFRDYSFCFCHVAVKNKDRRFSSHCLLFSCSFFEQCQMSEVGFKPTPLNGGVGVNYFIALSMNNLRRCNYSMSHLNESLSYAVFKVAHKFGLFIIGYAKIIISQIQ